MVLVHDEVARAQVSEGLERATRRRRATGRALAEDLRVRQEDHPELAPDESASRRRDREEKLRLVRERLTRLEQARLHAAEEVRRAQRLAAMRECDDDAVPGADQAGQLGLGLREPPGRHGRALGLERERLPARERIELGCAAQRQLRLELLGPDLPHLLRLPDQVGRAVERPHQITRDPSCLAVVGEPRLLQVEPAFGGRIDDCVAHVLQRALGERRERADGLDHVAEELHAERVTARRREDVDEPAPDGELAALLHAVHPLVPGEREVLGHQVEVARRSGRERERLRAGRRRRHGLRERRGGGADEPSSG